MKNKIFLYLFKGLFFCLCNEIQSKSVVINVWVHGTYPFMNIVASKHSPFRSWIYTEEGLSLAKNLPYSYYFHNLAYELQARNMQEYDVNHFYTYGWYSSKVRPNHRREEGEKLYRALEELLTTYQNTYDQIKLRVVGFSHGGNVVLHFMQNMPFVTENIETEIVLLATPIQESTRLFVNKNCVSRVYSFYSDSDWIQRIDMQKFHCDAPCHCPVLSNRTFQDSDRVIQIRLKINGQFIGHNTYRSIVKHLPNMIRFVDNYIGLEKDTAHILLDFKVDS